MSITLVGALPSGTAAWDGAAALRARLLAERGVAPAIRVTANRRRVLAWRARPPEVSVHWALLPHLDLLVRVLAGDEAAWPQLRTHLPTAPPPEPRGPEEPVGEAHDLRPLLARAMALSPRPAEATIRWGAYGRAPRRSLRLGSCAPGTPGRITIHPVLDHPTVPDWFVGFVVYHELLHVVFPPIAGEGRRSVHPRSFRQAERRHPDHARALAWERENLEALLRRCRASTR